MALGSLVVIILKVFSSAVKLVSTAQELLKSWWVPTCLWRHLKSSHSLVLWPLAVSFLQPTDDSEKAGFKLGFKPVDSLTAVSCIAQRMLFFHRSPFLHLRFFYLLYLVFFCYFSYWTNKENSCANLKPSLVTCSLASSRNCMASLKSLSTTQGCNAVICMDQRENELSPELVPQTISISHFLPWEATQQCLWEWLQEHNLQLPVGKNRGRSSEGKHKTEPVQKYCIGGAYTADLATSTIGGSHQRRGTHGRRATAQKQSVWTRMQVPTCTEFQTCCICPLATKMVSSWFHMVAVEASQGFAQQSFCRFSLYSYRQHSSRGKESFWDVLMPALIP